MTDSFKIFIDPINDGSAGEKGKDRGSAIDVVSNEVDNVREDMKNVEQLYFRLQEANEEVKDAQNAKAMKDLRAQLITDLDYLLKLAKQINQKFDGLVKLNASQRRIAGSGAGSEDDRKRASMISDLTEDLKGMMLNFEGLRVQFEADNRQLIESRYSALTGEKATSEAIDTLIESQPPDTSLLNEIQQHGHSAVSEIQERRDTLNDIRRCLMDLHQIFLGITTPVDVHDGGGPPSPIEAEAAHSQPVVGKPGPIAAAQQVAAKLGAGIGGLSTHEKEIRKQAYIALSLAIVAIVVIITVLLNIENNLESDGS